MLLKVGTQWLDRNLSKTIQTPNIADLASHQLPARTPNSGKLNPDLIRPKKKLPIRVPNFSFLIKLEIEIIIFGLCIFDALVSKNIVWIFSVWFSDDI